MDWMDEFFTVILYFNFMYLYNLIFSIILIKSYAFITWFYLQHNIDVETHSTCPISSVYQSVIFIYNHGKIMNCRYLNTKNIEVLHICKRTYVSANIIQTAQTALEYFLVGSFLRRNDAFALRFFIAPPLFYLQDKIRLFDS